MTTETALAFLGRFLNLPMTARHVVATGVERLPANHTDSPIVVRAGERLGHDEGGLLQKTAEECLEFFWCFRLDDALRKRAIRSLQDARVSKGGAHLVTIACVHGEGPRAGDAVFLEDLRLRHLVAAAQNRLRVVDHDEALLCGWSREAI